MSMRNSFIFGLVVFCTFFLIKSCMANAFSSKKEECIYKQMMYYHAGRGNFFVTVEERGVWYFYNGKKVKCRFELPPKEMLKTIQYCNRKRNG